jgi:hypothetical protein
MRYKNILSKAYNLTIRNPQLWLFGLVLSGGFNLSFINFFALVPNSQWKTWPLAMQSLFGGSAVRITAVIFAAIFLFIALNFLKILFIVIAHNLIHVKKEIECNLCLRYDNKPLPYFTWLNPVMFSSAITIVLTAGITLAINAIIGQGGYSNAAPIIVNLVFIAIMTCILGTWNAFTTYFIILHGFNFEKASQGSMDLIVMRARQIVEFVAILSVIYLASVFIGNSFIHAWQNGIAGMTIFQIQMASLLIFVLWTAINNSFFNTSFLLFFDNLVKSEAVEEEESEAVQSLPNIVN